jgi:hypothetical protein
MLVVGRSNSSRGRTCTCHSTTSLVGPDPGAWHVTPGSLGCDNGSLTRCAGPAGEDGESQRACSISFTGCCWPNWATLTSLTGRGRCSTAPTSGRSEGRQDGRKPGRPRTARKQAPCGLRRPGDPTRVSLTGGNAHHVTRLLPLIDAIPRRRRQTGPPRRLPRTLLADRGTTSTATGGRCVYGVRAHRPAHRVSSLCPLLAGVGYAGGPTARSRARQV